MISHIICYSVLMREFKQSQACHLEEIFLFLSQNDLNLLVINPIQIEHLFHIIFRKGLERASVILSRSRCYLVDDLSAIPSLVVILLPFLSKHMSDIIGIVLFESIPINFLTEFTLPEQYSFIHCQSKSLDKQSQL